MSEKRIIKKYPNRRLYDTAISSYITLEDVRKLVLDDIIVQVIDARTKDDLTHNTLLQIVVEQEEKNSPLFTTETLQKLIQVYGEAKQLILRQVFEESFSLYEQKSHEQFSQAPLSSSAPSAVINQMTDENVKTWQQLQEQAPEDSPLEPLDYSEKP